MNDQDRIDFSPLDPSRDGPRWAGLIDSIAARAATAARRPTRSVSAQLGAWMGPALALAAGVALVVWLAPTTAARRASPPATAAAREAPAFTLQSWVLGGHDGSVWEQLEMLGVDDEQR